MQIRAPIDSSSDNEENSETSSDESLVGDATITLTSESEAVHLSPSSDSESNLSSDESCLMDISESPVLPQSMVTSEAPKLNDTSELDLSEDPLGYKLVGDNLDHPRYMRVDDYRAKSLHYFNSYAVKDRVNFDNLSAIAIPTCMPNPKIVATSLLPSQKDDNALHDNIIILVARVITTHMLFFKTSFSDAIDWHITHDHYKEMSMKSEVVNL